MTLADRIKARRTALQWTQSRLALRLSVTTATVSRWERGRSRPRFRARQALAQLLELPAPAAPGAGAPGPLAQARVEAAARRIARALQTVGRAPAPPAAALRPVPATYDGARAPAGRRA
jgi:transcriptional regulator with XRE-family HTH domain